MGRSTSDLSAVTNSNASVWGHEAAHVLDAYAIGAHVPQASYLRHVVVEIVDVAAHATLVGDGVAHGKLEVLAGLLDGVRGALQVRLVVQGVEDAEDVDSVFSGPLHERIYDIVGVVPVSDQGLSSEEHSERRVSDQSLE